MSTQNAGWHTIGRLMMTIDPLPKKNNIICGTCSFIYRQQNPMSGSIGFYCLLRNNNRPIDYYSMGCDGHRYIDLMESDQDD